MKVGDQIKPSRWRDSLWDRMLHSNIRDLGRANFDTIAENDKLVENVRIIGDVRHTIRIQVSFRLERSIKVLKDWKTGYRMSMVQMFALFLTAIALTFTGYIGDPSGNWDQVTLIIIGTFTVFTILNHVAHKVRNAISKKVMI